jgi:hypothetical protein
MLLQTIFKTTVALIAVTMIAVPASAQETETESKTAVAEASAENSWLSAEGELKGSVVTVSHDESVEVSDARVSLVSKGKVIDSVKADASGNFAFANVQPGPYQIVGNSAGMVGTHNVNVGPYVAAQPMPTNQVVLQQGTPHVTYDNWGEVPVSSMSSAPVPAGQPSFGYAGGAAYSGGGGPILGGGGGGGLARRLLTTPRGLLIVGGIAGGLAAIDDSSPDM